MADSKMSMKLFVDNSKRKVLFAESGQECVDLLVHILALPVGTVVGFLTKEPMAGAIGSLCASIQNLSTNYFLKGVNKDMFLSPNPATSSKIPLLTINPHPPPPQTIYICSKISTTDKSHVYFADSGSAYCPEYNCWSPMSTVLRYVAPSFRIAYAARYVKQAVTYTFMDDLPVRPMSMESSISLLSKFGVQDAANLEEIMVYLDMSLVVQLLKASLISKTVLTDVFLAKKDAGPR